MQRFRTTVSLVYWTETPEQSDAIVSAATAALPEDDQKATLSTVEYISAGRPPEPEPTPEPVVPGNGADGVGGDV